MLSDFGMSSGTVEEINKILAFYCYTLTRDKFVTLLQVILFLRL